MRTPFPVINYRLARRYANGAVVRPLPGKNFSATEQASIADWLTAAGWKVVTRAASGISVVGSKGMTIDDIPEPYTTAQRKKDAIQALEDQARRKALEEQAAYLKTAASRAFIFAKFGDALNDYTAWRLARYLDGTDREYGGIMSHKMADAISGMGIVVDGRNIKDILADVKTYYKNSRLLR
jgi:ribosomal protein L9